MEFVLLGKVTLLGPITLGSLDPTLESGEWTCHFSMHLPYYMKNNFYLCIFMQPYTFYGYIAFKGK